MIFTNKLKLHLMLSNTIKNNFFNFAKKVTQM
jgi:hypothetical protein